MLAYAALAALIACFGFCAFLHLRNAYDCVAIYFAFFALYFILRPVMLLTGIDSPFPDYLFGANIQASLFDALVFACVWVVGMTIGLGLSFLRQPVSLILPTVPEAINYRYLAAVVLVLGCLPFATALFLFSKFGANIQAITLAVRVEKLFAGFAYITQAGELASYLATACFYARLKEQRELRQPLHPGWYLLWLVGLMAVATSLLYGDRDQIIFWLVFNVVCYSLFVHRLSLPALGGLVVGALALLTGLKYLRDFLWWGTISARDDDSGIGRALASGGNLDVFDKYMFVVSQWEQHFLRLGEDFRIGFLGMVPRALWPDKPIHIYPGAWFRNQIEPGSVNGWPITPLGEWYLNFGGAGLLMGGIAAGLVFAAIRYKYSAFARSPIMTMVMYVLATRVLFLGYHAVTPMFYVNWIIPLLAIFLGMRLISRARPARA